MKYVFTTSSHVVASADFAKSGTMLLAKWGDGRRHGDEHSHGDERRHGDGHGHGDEMQSRRQGT